MSQKAILTKGIIASGKSTFAEKLLKEDNSYRRVNRDYIRHCTNAYQYTKENESLVQKIWKQMVKEILESGYNLIIDEQNLNPDIRKSNIEFVKNIIQDIEIRLNIFQFLLKKQ